MSTTGNSWDLRFRHHHAAAFLAIASVLVACGATDGKSVAGTSTTTDGSGTVPAEGEDAANDDPTQPAQSVLEDVAVTGVAVFQGVKVDVVKNGAWVTKRNAPVVAGRPAVVRVYVTPAAGFTARKVTAELRITSEGTTLPVQRLTQTVKGASKDETPGSTFDFEVPAENLQADSTFQVALTGEGAVLVEGEADGRFPKDGTMQPLGAKPVGALRIVIVPVKYDADGSGRVPDTSEAQLERYRKVFSSRYPTAEVDVSVREPLSWTTPITRNGAGFSQVLRAITQLRQQDRVAPDVYYYGALAPAASFRQFCSGGCVLGLSSVVEDANTSLLRASVGIGYANEESASTAAHEIGHAHGREHAPCGGAQGVDPKFPYTGGGIGVWGYDISTKEFISPTRGKDMMGYCPNEWVSDYTFSALFDRISAISTPKATPSTGTGTSAGNGSAPATFTLATVEADGTISAGPNDTITVDEAISGGELRDVEYSDATGTNVARETARYFRFDHLPGGFLLLPTRIGPTTLTRVRLAR